MIVSEEMEKTVDEKKFHFIHEIDACRRGVTGGRFDGKDDIPEDLRIDIAEFSFRHRKRDHIGRTVPFEISLVVFPDLIVIDQKETDFTLFAVEVPSAAASGFSATCLTIDLELFLSILN